MAQFIFKRRDIQKWLDELRPKIGIFERAKIASDLNNGDRLETMWELAFVEQASRESGFEYEKPLENGKKPDFKIELSNDIGSFEVIGDVTTLSDKHLDVKNPVDFFMEEKFRLLKKEDLLDVSHRFQIEHTKIGKGKKSRTTLLLPPKGQIPKFIKDEVIPIFRKWQENPNSPQTVRLESEGVDITFKHTPNDHYSGGGYAGYQSVETAEQSSLFNKLKNKKEQLKGIPDNAVNLLIICDADSHVLWQKNCGPFVLNDQQITAKFLSKNSSLDMVLLVTVEDDKRFHTIDNRKRLRTSFLCQNENNRRSALTQARIDEVFTVLTNWVESLPRPLQMPANAIRRLKEPIGPTNIGGCSVSHNQVTVSSRRVQEVLAGIATPDEWREDFGNSRPSPIQVFLRNRLEGRMIVKVEVSEADGDDDDMLTFYFGDPDAAISDFQACEEE